MTLSKEAIKNYYLEILMYVNFECVDNPYLKIAIGKKTQYQFEFILLKHFDSEKHGFIIIKAQLKFRFLNREETLPIIGKDFD